MNFEVVLASGQVINANAHENSDFWKVLRGGGNNFCVATRFDLKTFKQGGFWGGAFFYSPKLPSTDRGSCSRVQKARRIQRDTHHAQPPLGCTIRSTDVLESHVQLYYTQPNENPPELEPFSTVQPRIEQMSSARMINMKDAAAEQAAMAMDGIRYSHHFPRYFPNIFPNKSYWLFIIRCAYMNTTVKADVAVLNAGANTFPSAIEDIKQSDGLVCSLTLQPYPVHVLEKCVSEGGNCTGLNPADGPLVSVLLLLYWNNESNDEAILKVTKKILQTIERCGCSGPSCAVRVPELRV